MSIQLMSIGFLVGEDDPVIWRGAMVDKMLTQRHNDVAWGNLDYSVVVTTPQDVALDNARKGARMFDRHDTAVLGVVENMSTFACPDCGSAHDIFDTSGGSPSSSASAFSRSPNRVEWPPARTMPARVPPGSVMPIPILRSATHSYVSTTRTESIPRRRRTSRTYARLLASRSALGSDPE